MNCNLSKCKELTFRKKGCNEDFTVVFNILQCRELKVLGVNFQEDCTYKLHVHSKLIKVNKCLYIISSLRKECYNEVEVNYLFYTLVLSDIYDLAVYGASDAELNTIQCFLDRCFKRRCVSQSVNIYELLEKQDRHSFRKASSNEVHPVRKLIPKTNSRKYELRKKSSHYPEINSEHFQNIYVNLLTFKYEISHKLNSYVLCILLCIYRIIVKQIQLTYYN